MTAPAVQSSNPSTTASNIQSQQTAKSEATLQDVLDTMHESDIFPRTGKDVPSRFWSAYERVAKQHDDEFIERHNSELDVLLIFAGLFSAVSSAFIVNMQSSLSPNASDTTNALLKILINKIDNSTFPAQEATLPVWTGPSSTIIWIQTLAYTSLSSSLFAAFGAVLGKQWLGYFKTSRFGRGELHERCRRRQRKFVGLETWHFSTILATLPVFLQLSLLFFGIALAADMWVQQQTIAGVIMATTSFGFLFYLFTVVASLKSPDCPFQTPVSSMLQHIGKVNSTFWARFPPYVLRQYSRRAVYNAKVLLTRSIEIFGVWLSQLLFTLRHQSSANDPEVAPESEHSRGTGDVLGQLASDAAGEQTASFEVLDLSRYLEHLFEAFRENEIQCSAVQWILETSTDTDVITAAARVVPEIEWPEDSDVIDMLGRLYCLFCACFDSTCQMLPLARARATACLKAICHLHMERNMEDKLRIESNGRVHFLGGLIMPPDHDFRVIYCATNRPLNLDITSLSSSDRMWLAHVFVCRMNNSEDHPYPVAFVIDFVRICLDPESPRRLIADCLLLAGMLVGLRVNRGCLIKLDKKSDINKIRPSVVNRILGILVGDIPGSKWHEAALKLVHPLLQFNDREYGCGVDEGELQRCLKFCFRLLEDVGAMGEDQVRSLAILLRWFTRTRNSSRSSTKYTQTQIDQLVDYHLQNCEGTDHKATDVTFKVLARLGASPSTQGRMRRYIDTMIQYMDITPDVLLAAWTVRSAIVSLGQEDESFRERFSEALSSAATNIITSSNITYLRFLNLFLQVPTWHPQLHQNDHFDNCVALANVLLSWKDYIFDWAQGVPAGHVLASVAGGELKAVCGYPNWPVILTAWRCIFNLLQGSLGTDRKIVSTTKCIAALPSLVALAKRRCGNSEGPDVVALAEQVLYKLNEERQNDEQDGSQDKIFVSGECHDLIKEICRLLDAM